jgi:hypothetical protein
VWLPGALGGHWWSSDHAQGLCRQDPVPGTTINAINFAVCGSDLVGSAGQAVYDSRVNPIGLGTVAGTHYVYVPDNAVKSTSVWRLTFNPATETMVPDPLDGVTMATAMATLVDQTTLKPNGMALGPDGNLYISDLTDGYVRQLANPTGDPRLQAVGVVAQTGDARGANGTQGFIGNYLYVSGNRATQFFDITQCPPVGNTAPGPLTGVPCGMASVPAPTGVFVAGTATDAPHKLVYISASPGGANATIYRYDASQDLYVRFAAGSIPGDANNVIHCDGIGCLFGPTAVTYLTGGNLPGPATPNGTVWCSLTCTRPWDLTNHPTTATTAPVPTGWSFVFGLGLDPNGILAITEDPTAGARSGRGTMWTVPFLA